MFCEGKTTLYYQFHHAAAHHFLVVSMRSCIARALRKLIIELGVHTGAHCDGR